MRLFNSNKRSSTRTSRRPSRSSSFLSSLNLMSWSLAIVLLGLLSLSSLSVVSAGPTPGFCGDCQTFANAISGCGVTFGPPDIEINGTYTPPQSAAKCICTDVMQRVLWTCAKCELLAGFNTHTPPPTLYQTTCIGWGTTITEWRAPYTGVVAPGTLTTPLTSPGGGTITQPAVNTGAGTTVPATNPTGGNNAGSATVSGTAPSLPSSSADSAVSGVPSGTSSGPSGTAIGISFGIIGVAAVAGAVAVFMMKRRRRRHEPLELDGTYVGLEDQWEKPARAQSPPMIPAAIASGAPIASRGPMQTGHRPSPFESRPGGGGSVIGGYDGQYDQYDHQYAHYPAGPPGGGYDAHNNHGGYNQGYGHHDYGYEHTVPTSGPFHGGKGGEGGQYL